MIAFENNAEISVDIKLRCDLKRCLLSKRKYAGQFYRSFYCFKMLMKGRAQQECCTDIKIEIMSLVKQRL